MFESIVGFFKRNFGIPVEYIKTYDARKDAPPQQSKPEEVGDYWETRSARKRNVTENRPSTRYTSPRDENPPEYVTPHTIQTAWYISEGSSTSSSCDSSSSSSSTSSSCDSSSSSSSD